MPRSRLSFGQIDKLPSGNFRARYTGPDGKRHPAPTTFPTKGAASTWLAEQQTLIASGRWEPPAAVAAKKAKAEAERIEREVTLDAYARTWLATRTNAKGQALRPRTIEEYERLLNGPLEELKATIVGDISAAQVRTWRAGQLQTGKTTQTSRAYSLLSSILRTAVIDGLAVANPCVIRGGGQASTGKKVQPPTDIELQTILDNIPVGYQALVLVAAIGGLRYGEAVALHTSDIGVERDDVGAVIAVRIAVTKGVTVTKKGKITGRTKSEAGIRTIGIFGDDARTIADHVRMRSKDRIGDVLMFPSVTDETNPLPQSTFFRHWAKAVAAAGREDLPFHGLRHFAGTRYAQTGATVAETMARLGHASSKAAMRYQHSGSRDDELAARMQRRTS